MPVRLASQGPAGGEVSRVDDQGLTTRKENEAFKRERHVASTPQVFIGSMRVGGYDASQTHLGDRPPDPDATTYTPVLVVFALAALTGRAMSWAAYGMLLSVRAEEWFIAV